MAAWFISLHLSLLCLPFLGICHANTIPKFPVPIFKPERLSISTPNQLYTESFFTQILDHFTFTYQSYQTFQHRYLINDSYWGGASSNAPIFVYTGNEGDIEWFAQNTGFMFDVAPRFKALLVFIEHRFYGKSLPFGGNKSVAYSNASTLGYLTSTQALADYATLILDLKNNLSAIDSPVIVFGGSYGGMLAAWFRLKYPHVALGALASSAPILQFENITSPDTFYDTVANDFRSESENCYKVLKESWQQIDNTASQPGGLDLLRKSFRICNNYISSGSLQGWFRRAWIYTAMTDYPTPSNFLAPMPAYPVKQMCKAIDDPTTGNDTLAKLYGAVNVYYNFTGTATCFNLADDSDPHGLGEWSWQASTLVEDETTPTTYHAHQIGMMESLYACTEMIMPLASSNQSIFPPSNWIYSERASICYASNNVYPRRNWITTEFGGQNIKRVLKRSGGNIIFFNGLRDPWSGGGVLQNISESIIAIVAEEGAHHVDLRFATSEDPKWLQDVRKREVKIMETWLAEYYTDLAYYA